jgi:biotin carboxyl carrier protein
VPIESSSAAIVKKIVVVPGKMVTAGQSLVLLEKEAA